MTSSRASGSQTNATKVAGADQNDESGQTGGAVDPPRIGYSRLVVMMLGRTIVKGTSPRRATRRCSAMLLDNVYVFGCDAYFSKSSSLRARDTQSSKSEVAAAGNGANVSVIAAPLPGFGVTYAVDT